MQILRLTINYGLKKPEGSDVVNIDDFNYNADIIDSTMKEIKSEVGALELKAEKVTVADRSNLFDATNVEDALLENKTSIQNVNSNISKLQSSVSTNKTNISNLQSNVSSLQSEINGQRLRGINIANAIIDKLEG